MARMKLITSRSSSKIAAIVSTVALAGLMTMPSLSPAKPRGGDRSQTIPGGSYQNTCANVTIENLLGGPGRNLQADCQNRRGVYVKTFLALPCNGDIQNQNGRLVCVPGNHPFAPPKGSYMARCRNIELNGPILSARCTSVVRGTTTTSINTLKCRGRDIRVRLDGNLAC